MMSVSNHYYYTVKKKSTTDFWVFSTYFLGNFSTFCCINLKQKLRKLKNLLKLVALKFEVCPTFFFTVYYTFYIIIMHPTIQKFGVMVNFILF